MTGPTPTAAPQGAEPAADPNAASPEEQRAYEQAMNNAFRLIYEEKAFPEVLERLQATPDPVEGLAAVVATTVSRLADSARKGKAPIAPDVLFKVGTDLIEDVADLAEKAGIHAYTPKEAEGALDRALDLFRDMNPDAVDGEAAMGDLEQLKAAQDSGELDKRFPELARHAAGMQPAEGPEGEPAEGEEDDEAPAEEPAPPARRGLLKGGR